MRRRAFGGWGGLLVAALAGLPAVGCSESNVDPRFVAASQKREERIAHILHNWQLREEEGPYRVKKTSDQFIKWNEEDPEQLRNTWAMIHKRAQFEVDEWPDRLHRTQAYIEDQLDGDPANIDRTIPRMFY